MRNCFTEVINYLNLYYDLPNGWKDYKLDVNNMDLYVEQEKKFLARKEHIGFFKSFCKPVKKAEKNDIVLTRTSVGCAINKFAYWVYNEDLKHIEHKLLDKKCLVLRINNG